MDTKNIENKTNNEDVVNNENVVVDKSDSAQKVEKRINIDNLIKEYNKRTSSKMKKEFLKTVIKIKPYVSYGAKLILADGIINASCLKNGNVHIDSCKKYILYIYSLIKQYTNIDINEKELLFQYDLLDQYGLVEEILELIPEKEIVTFKTILDMKQNDLMTNRYGTQAFISEQIDKVKTISPEVIKAFTPLLETLNEKLNNLDENKIEKMINKAVKTMKVVK